MPNYIIVSYIVGLMFLCVCGIITFDRLVQLQRRAHPEEWEHDGKPWHDFGVEGGAAWKRCSIAWLFSIAPWMRADKDAARLLRVYRGMCLAFNAALLAGILYRVL